MFSRAQSPTDQHDDVVKWKHFPGYCPFGRGIHRSLVNSPHKGQWTFMFSLICAWTEGWANNWIAGLLWRHCNDFPLRSWLSPTRLSYKIDWRRLNEITWWCKLSNSSYISYQRGMVPVYNVANLIGFSCIEAIWNREEEQSIVIYL